MNGQSLHIVQLETLDLGEHLFEFQLDNSYVCALEKSELLSALVDVQVRLIVREDDFSVDVDMMGKVQVTCDRCLEAMEIDVDVYEEEIEFEDEPKSLDLAWLAYELIIVNLPLVHSHQDGGCNPEMAALLQNHLCTAQEENE